MFRRNLRGDGDNSCDQELDDENPSLNKILI